MANPIEAGINGTLAGLGLAGIAYNAERLAEAIKDRGRLDTEHGLRDIRDASINVALSTTLLIPLAYSVTRDITSRFVSRARAYKLYVDQWIP